MDYELLTRLGDHLREHIKITAGPRIGMIIPQSFKVEGCDHTFGLTTTWLEANGLDAAASIDWIRRQGADCDCKIITDLIPGLDKEI